MTPPGIKHDLPFDPTCGYDLDALLKVPAPPGPYDLDAFWRQIFDQTMAVPLNISRPPIPSTIPGRDCFEIEFDGLDGFRVGAFLTVPADRPVTCGLVVSHGYGGREAPDDPVPGLPAAMIFPCARGMGRSRRADLPQTADRHVLHGIQSRRSYIHLACAADIWSAASVLIKLFSVASDRLYYYGGSFGGGIGALALPWDERIKKAYFCVPSFGNHPLRITLPCNGSGHFVSRYHRDHPQVLDVLQYFDSATAARRIRIPTLVAPALFDPAVPPPGQFAVYNALAGPKELFVLSAGHWGYEGEAAEGAQLLARIQAWFSK